MSTTVSSPKSNRSSLTYLAVATAITLLLFYIDEGYYNFNWMKNPGNWIPFVIYVGALFLSQLFVANITLKRYTGKHRTTLSAFLGISLILITLFIIIL